jgi:hypothetical protein
MIIERHNNKRGRIYWNETETKRFAFSAERGKSSFLHWKVGTRRYGKFPLSFRSKASTIVRGQFYNMSWPLGVKLDPRVELSPRGEIYPPRVNLVP